MINDTADIDLERDRSTLTIYRLSGELRVPGLATPLSLVFDSAFLR